MGKLKRTYSWMCLSNHKYWTVQKVKLPGFLNRTFLSQIFCLQFEPIHKKFPIFYSYFFESSNEVFLNESHKPQKYWAVKKLPGFLFVTKSIVCLNSLKRVTKQIVCLEIWVYALHMKIPIQVSLKVQRKYSWMNLTNHITKSWAVKKIVKSSCIGVSYRVSEGKVVF